MISNTLNWSTFLGMVLGRNGTREEYCRDTMHRPPHITLANHKGKYKYDGAKSPGAQQQENGESHDSSDGFHPLFHAGHPC